MCVPVIFFGQCLSNAVVEVFVVRENDMAADIVELGACQSRSQQQQGSIGEETYKAFWCDVCRS